MPAAILPLRVLEEDPVRLAVQQLAAALPARADSRVLLALLEDELREGLDALGDVQAHFDEVLAALGAPTASPRALLEASDVGDALERLESLLDLLSQLRRRLAHAAGLLATGGRATT